MRVNEKNVDYTHYEDKMHIVLTCACVPKVVTIKQRLSHMFLVKFLHLCSYL